MRRFRRSRYTRFSSHLRRDILNYKYIKRNLCVAGITVALAGLTAFVVKYGEAIDDRAGLTQSSNQVATVSYDVETEFMDDDSIAIVMDSLHTKEAAVAPMKADVVAEAEEPGEFQGKFVVKIEDSMNVRATASTDSAVVGKMIDGTVGEIVESDGEWLKVVSGDVTGYIKSEYVITGEEGAAYAESTKSCVGTINDVSVRVRAEESTDSEILTLAEKDAKYDVISYDDQWVSIDLGNNEVGYVSADFIDVEESYVEAMTVEQYNDQYGDVEEVPDETPAVDKLATEVPTTETVTTEVATTEEVKTEAPTTEIATTEEVKTEAPTTEKATTEETKVEETTDSGSYSDSYLLACLVSMEAGSESYEGQLAVANVVLNRVRSGKWGSSISSVIYAKGQFPCATGSVMKGYLKNGPIASAQKAADAALAGNNNIGSYMSFLNKKYVDTNSLSSYEIIGNHCFY